MSKMMLGRKQSLKTDQILADYGPDEAFNENADIEWVNKVRNGIKSCYNIKYHPNVFIRIFLQISVLKT